MLFDEQSKREISLEMILTMQPNRAIDMVFILNRRSSLKWNTALRNGSIYRNLDLVRRTARINFTIKNLVQLKDFFFVNKRTRNDLKFDNEDYSIPFVVFYTDAVDSILWPFHTHSNENWIDRLRIDWYFAQSPFFERIKNPKICENDSTVEGISRQLLNTASNREYRWKTSRRGCADYNTLNDTRFWSCHLGDPTLSSGSYIFRSWNSETDQILQQEKFNV